MGKGATGKSRKRYDKHLVRDRTLEVLSIRLGSPKDQGARLVWDCAACGKQEKYSVKKADGKGGCLVADCRLAGHGDVFVMLAGLEDLDYQADFLAVLERAYELLGLEPSITTRKPCGDKSGDKHAGDRAVELSGQHEASKAGTGCAVGSYEAVSSSERASLLELAADVYERILDLCPLESRDRTYLREERGISNETIRRARFGTMTAPRARKIKAVLQREFGREELLKVPGFSLDEKNGRLKFTLTGNYILIPYHDEAGRVTTIEGRAVSGHAGTRRYVTLRRAGNHLYLFPGQKVEELQAVCEGVMGAIVAADCGLAVGSIMGCGRYKASPSPEMLDGASGDPLLELKGANFGGRTVYYIPDADDPPNPNVLRAAPKAARWISEPQNGTAAICLLPEGTDLDEWLLSLPPEERGSRFLQLLAGANPPEDGNSAVPCKQRAPASRAPKASGPPDGESCRSGQAPTAGEPGETASQAPADTGTSEPKNGARFNMVSGKSETEQPGLWDGSGDDREESRRRSPSAGARRVRDEVYRAVIEALPPKEEHLEALESQGVMRAAARVGGFASLDRKRGRRAVSNLTECFGAKRLLSVPGFEPDGTGKLRLCMAAAGGTRSTGEYLLLPCFDAAGRLSGVEGLAYDPKRRKLEVEQTVPLKGAGSHLYVFAAYRPHDLEGFCEGPLGALLAAQEDVVIGAIGGFRRYKAASGPGEERQPLDAVLPELEGVDFSGRQLPYAPRSGMSLGEQNARYHAAESAARWLAKRQSGCPAVVALGDGQEAPSSLGGWIQSLDEDGAKESLRELFPQRPAAEGKELPADACGEEHEPEEQKFEPTFTTKVAYLAVALAAVAAAATDLLILRLREFAGYINVRPNGDPVLYDGALGFLRELADSAPFRLLYELHGIVAFTVSLILLFAILSKVHRIHRSRWRVDTTRQKERREPQVFAGGTTPSRALLTPGEVLWAAISWPLAYLLAAWLIGIGESLFQLATTLQMASGSGPLVSDPVRASIYVATLSAVFVLWRRRSIRAAEVNTLRGKIRH